MLTVTEKKPTPETYTPPFKRLNQKETLQCLQHAWTGRATFVKARPATMPDGLGKYGCMEWNALSKIDYASAVVFPAGKEYYRMVDWAVVAALQKKGLVTVTQVSEREATFQLKTEAP